LPGQRGAYPGYLVRRDRGTRTGPAQHHAIVGLARHHRGPDGSPDVGPLVGIGDAYHVMTLFGEVPDDSPRSVVLVVSRIGDSHLPEPTNACYRPSAPGHVRRYSDAQTERSRV